MESQALLQLAVQLDGNLQNLEEALSPILEDSLSATTKKLPLLDRAKLNITVVYAIESLLFSYLKVNGVDAKEHGVFKEIERVKQYFVKIKEAEEKSVKPNMQLNKQAAARIIQHSLAGNGPSDLTQREREIRERLLAKRKLKATTAAPAPVAALVPASEDAPISVAEDVDSLMRDADKSSAEEGEIEDDRVPLHQSAPSKLAIANGHATPNKKRKQRHNPGQSSKLSAEDKAAKKARRKAKKQENGVP